MAKPYPYDDTNDPPNPDEQETTEADYWDHIYHLRKENYG